MEVERNTVLVTGGAGTFGRAFVKEALKFCPKALRVLDNSEIKLVEMQREFRDPCLRFMHGDVRDKDRLKQLMAGVDIVVHTAALKHVPICEYNPSEAIKTNISGSLNIVETAIECGVRKVIGISTDKAVHPINTYGATKLVMERLFSEANNYTQTKFSCVRFGNFWASDGSVIELWKKQAKEGRSITMTDKDMSRFWINQDEAVAFTIECLDKMQGGEIFIPLMPLHTLKELADAVAPGSQIEVIGKRRGEKKHEELYTEDEARYLTRTDKALIIKFT